MVRPTELPEWASQDQNDPASGEPNVQEPPEARKDSGWNRDEIPTRQWFNWLARLTYRWIEELAAENDAIQAKESKWDAASQAGLMMYWPGSTPPTGWLERNGAILNVADYPDLANVLGAQFGGDGITTFGLPDDRGEFVRGWDNGRGVDSGRGIGSLQNEQTHPHVHQWYQDPGPGGRIDATSTGGAAGTYDSDGNDKSINTTEVYGDLYTNSQTNLSTGETRPRNRAWMPIIKY